MAPRPLPAVSSAGAQPLASWPQTHHTATECCLWIPSDDIFLETTAPRWLENPSCSSSTGTVSRRPHHRQPRPTPAARPNTGTRIWRRTGWRLAGGKLSPRMLTCSGATAGQVCISWSRGTITLFTCRCWWTACSKVRRGKRERE